MKRFLWLLMGFLLVSCQPQNARSTIYLLDGDKVLVIQADSNTPTAILAQAGIKLSPADKIHFNGVDLPNSFSLPPGGPYTLQIRRAHRLTLITPDGETTLQTTAATVGQALARTGLQLCASDTIEPALETPIKADMTVTYRPAREIAIRVDGETVTVKSSALTVGQALASAGIPLLGLDKSLPAESELLPADPNNPRAGGQIKVIRVNEVVSLVEKSIPFSKKYEYSVDLPVGTQKVLQAGEPGLTVSRVRVRYEDGVEVERTTEAETLVRQPKESIISLGTQVTIQTLDVPGGQIQYWRAVQMYATSYSPCRSGGSKCSYGTASGLPVKRGVVAVTRALYSQLAGSQVYIPGYGVATIGDVGGGFPDGRLWIDLAYSDENWQNWSSMVTVYFLAPAPASIPNILN